MRFIFILLLCLIYLHKNIFCEIKKLAFFARNWNFRRPVLLKKFSRRASKFFLYISDGKDQPFRKGQLSSSKKRYFGTPYLPSVHLYLIHDEEYEGNNQIPQRQGASSSPSPRATKNVFMPKSQES